MRQVSDGEADAVRQWLDSRGMTFRTGSNEETELTDQQIHQQCKMYVAAVRIGDEFGCDSIGSQYQQGVKGTCPASDLVEAVLNKPDRPPFNAGGGLPQHYTCQALT